MRTFMCAVLCALYSILCSSSARAAGEFSTSIVSTYTIESQNLSTVTHDIVITNNLANIYLTSYSISLGTVDVQNLTVLVQGHNSSVTRNSAETNTDLIIPIPNPSIGKDQTLELKISYRTASHITSHPSGVWEINIPRMSKANEAKSYTRRIILPNSFAAPTHTSPHPTSLTENEAGHSVIEYVGYPADSISLLFGLSASYKLGITYHLNNRGPSSVDTELALPMDTGYQRVQIDSINPPPKEIRLDADGNWLAIYNLKAGESRDVTTTLFVTVFPTPREEKNVPDNALTKPTSYWKADVPSIEDIIHKLDSPEKIYDYLVDNFVYDYGRVGITGTRIGGAAALQNPTEVICTEFTDAFITLARAHRIPSREINGIVYSPNPVGVDILHAWPEYYDTASNMWIEIDPTLGNTTGGLDYYSKLDFAHIAFVRHGREAGYPYPAGTYKSDIEEKTITLEPVEKVPPVEPSYELYEDDGRLMIKNTSQIAFHKQVVTQEDGSKFTIEYLPPYSSQPVEVNVQEKGSWLSTFVASVKNYFQRMVHFSL